MIEIRPAGRADHAALVALWSCPSFKAMLPKAAQDGRPPEPAYLASAASAMTRAGNVFLVVEDGAVVGSLNRFGKPATPEIGWFVAVDRRGRGVATRAAALFLDRLFAEGAETVRFGMFAGNAASARLAGKLGLEPLPGSSGPSAGHLRYEVARADWEARPAGPGPR